MSFKSFLLNLKSLGLKRSSSNNQKQKPEKNSKEKMALDVLVFGSSNIDFINYVMELPRTGETVFSMHREQCFGGKGANQCVAASKLGARTALISKLGNDELGSDYYRYLNDLEINLECMEIVPDHPTGVTEINVSENAQKMRVVLPGANLMLRGTDVTKCKRLFKRAKVLLCQLETDERAVLYALQHFKGASILNASPAHKNLSRDLIKAPTILCCNRGEAALLTDREHVVTVHDAKAAAADLLEMGAKSVIITMGDLGAIYVNSNEPDLCTHCPAGPVRYLADDSGATDAFIGSLAYHMAIYPNLLRESHIIAANICAAYAVGHRGTQPSFPGPEFFQERLCQYDPVYYIVSDEEPEPHAASAKPSTILDHHAAPAIDSPPPEKIEEAPKVADKEEEESRPRKTEMDDAGIKPRDTKRDTQRESKRPTQRPTQREAVAT